jgi:hypothetical protein
MPQEYVSFAVHEAGIGLGASGTAENDVFNIESDYDVGNVVSINLLYYYNLNENMALGGHVFGYFKTLKDLTFVTPDETATEDVDLNTYNIGGRFRYTFGRGAVQPYAFGGLSFSNGEIDSKFAGTLQFYGLSGVAGVGANLMNTDRFALAVEGVANFGFAAWEQKPFINSSGDEFDPSMFGGFVNFFYLWG